VSRPTSVGSKRSLTLLYSTCWRHLDTAAGLSAIASLVHSGCCRNITLRRFSSCRVLNRLAPDADRCKLGTGTRLGRAPARLVGRFLPRLGAACMCRRLFFSSYSRPVEDASVSAGGGGVFFQFGRSGAACSGIGTGRRRPPAARARPAAIAAGTVAPLRRRRCLCDGCRSGNHPRRVALVANGPSLARTPNATQPRPAIGAQIRRK